MDTPFFELRNVSKYFARVVANKDISFSIQRGEVLALLGENGAGKSTVMKILYGLYKADEGQIFMDGKEQKIGSPKDAMALGISMIQQHFSLVNAHTVTENIILGNVRGVIDYDRCKKEVEELAGQYGFDIPVDAKIADLAVGVQQKVEILKALYLKTSLLIMDEPTAVLTPQESETLMQFVKEYTAKGNSVIFITHKMKEVMEVADRIIVMRNGRLTGNLTAKETNEVELARLMMGKEMVAAKRDEEQDDQGKKGCLELKNVTVKHKGAMPVLDHLTFQIMEGEIFGVAGVSGNGQEELCEVICGALPVTEGSVFLKGKDITGTSVRERIGLGIGYVPVDRYRDAMVGDMTLAENMMLKTSFDRTWTRHGFLNRKKLYDHTQKAIEDFEIKAPGPDAQIRGLSGGNQQKVILAREVGNAGEMLVMDQPTRGLDLGAINNIHTSILEERRKGKGILLVSTELSEIFELCDRIAVIYKGAFMGIYRHDELTTERIGLLMAGYKEGKEA
ncbi:ABC transporter ATP-binding protein [Enterocloster aldensis]|uniref:ABC transporter ATP-binding protein n=1 Tax=Enterocloster aldenensis TaxID=358742 RepID=A0ABX2HJY7_9FIRM|nr:ABC transporter ATP-binding protein [Enterocloster aldenensis]